MKYLADQAHSRQLKLGLYAAASKETCRHYPGSEGYEEVDAATYAKWGADFVKLDSCGGSPDGPESWANQYSRWSKAMNASGRPMVFSCEWAVYYTMCVAKTGVDKCGQIPWGNGFISDICHMWRYGVDLSPVWDSPVFPGRHHQGHTLVHAYTHTLIHSYTHTLIHSYTHTLIHSHTHTLIHSYTHTNTISRSLTLSYSLTPPHSLLLSLPLPLTPAYSLLLPLTLSHSLKVMVLAGAESKT
jgi:hypothetical protein